MFIKIRNLYIISFYMQICCFIFCDLLDAPLWIMQLKWERYQKNELCMRRQNDELETFRFQPFHSIIAVENDTIWLPCFECLHPDDAEELEDVWKPSPSVIGRKINQFLDMIKKKIGRAKGSEKKNRNSFRIGYKSNYIWEKLNFENKWEQKPKSMIKKTKNKNEMDDKQTQVNQFINEIMQGNDKERFFIGSHLELEIRRANKAYEGWYRCLNKGENDQKQLNISQIYYVQVLQKRNITMSHLNNSDEFNKVWKEGDSDKFIPVKIISIPMEFPWLEIYGKASDWTQCNKCGKRIGEQRRTIQCFIRLKENWTPSENINIFMTFGELPCQSSLLPPELTKIMAKELFTVFEQFKECTSICMATRRNQKQIRNITMDDSDKPELLDVLPPNEFTVRERLPSLPPPILRRTIFANEGQRLVLDCSNQDGNSLIWRKNMIELNGTTILGDDAKQWILDKKQRRILTSKGQLIIECIMREDAGLYSCIAFPSGHILRTFRVYFVMGDKTKELLEVISLIFRALLFLYMLILMFDLMKVAMLNV